MRSLRSLALPGLAFAFALASPMSAAAANLPPPAPSLDLAGDWRFALDPQDAGLSANWQSTTLPGSIRLPGSLQDQGLGLPVTVDTPWTANVQDRSFWTADHHARDRREGDIRMPCWLTPTNHYAGPAWYQKTITLPEAW
nr:hypothetical protein [Opitutaceae bacterium]